MLAAHAMAFILLRNLQDMQALIECRTFRLTMLL